MRSTHDSKQLEAPIFGPLQEDDSIIQEIISRRERGEVLEILPEQASSTSTQNVNIDNLSDCLLHTDHAKMKKYIDDKYHDAFSGRHQLQEPSSVARAKWTRDWYYVHANRYFEIHKSSGLASPSSIQSDSKWSESQFGPITEEEYHIRDIMERITAGHFPEVLPSQVNPHSLPILKYDDLLESLLEHEQKEFEIYIDEQYERFLKRYDVVTAEYYTLHWTNKTEKRKIVARDRAQWARDYYYIHLSEFILFPRAELMPPVDQDRNDHYPLTSLQSRTLTESQASLQYLLNHMFHRNELSTIEQNVAADKGLSLCEGISIVERYRDTLSGANIKPRWEVTLSVPIHARWRERNTGEVIYHSKGFLTCDNLWTRSQIIKIHPEYQSVVITVSCYKSGKRYFASGITVTGDNVDGICITGVERKGNILICDDRSIRNLRKEFAHRIKQHYHAITLVSPDGHMLPCVYEIHHNPNLTDSCLIYPLDQISDSRSNAMFNTCATSIVKEHSGSYTSACMTHKRSKISQNASKLDGITSQAIAVDVYFGFVWRDIAIR